MKIPGEEIQFEVVEDDRDLTQELALGKCLALGMRRKVTTRKSVKMKKWMKRNTNVTKQMARRLKVGMVLC